MDESAISSLRASANAYFSQYEPLALVLAPIFSILIARLLQSAIISVQEKGLFGILMSIIKSIPGVKGYIDAEKQKVVDKLQSGGKSKRDGWRTELPTFSLGHGVIDVLKEDKKKDVAWQGKCSGTVYIAGSESEGHFSLINEACSMWGMEG